MTVDYFIKNNYKVVSPLTGINEIKNQLLENVALVVMEENQYFGVLTAIDLIRKPHLLVLDCICYKTEIEKECSLKNALFFMKRDNTDVLPVFENKKLIGLVHKSDILEYLNDHNSEVQNEVSQKTKILEQQNKELIQIIHNQKEELALIVTQRTKELIDLVETKEKFISIIVHELRNPFNSILGFLNLLMENLRNYDIYKIEKFLTSIYRSASITFELLINLSEWLNAKNNKIPFNPEKLCIYDLLAAEIQTTILCAAQKE